MAQTLGVLIDMFHADFLKLLTKFQRIDQTGKGSVSAVEFRACLESFFGGEISDNVFNDLMKNVGKESNGKIDYQSFLSKFDCDDSKTIFDSVSSLGDADDRNYFTRSVASSSLTSAYSRQSLLSPAGPVSGNRDVSQISAEIKAKVNGDFQLVADVFHELDEKNTKRMNAEVLHKLLTKLGVSVAPQESNTLYKHILTDQNGTLEFSQFVRHFGFSIKSAVYPNAKRNPPSRGDQDFRILSHRFNSSKELVEDLVKNVVEQRPDEVTQLFLNVDKSQTGTVSEEDFKRILLSLCGDLTLQEQKMLVARYGVSGVSGVSWRKFMGKMCPPKVVRRSTDVIVHHESEDE